MAIHLNNAGTTWPKPDEVAAAVQAAHLMAPGTSGQVLDHAQQAAAWLLNVPDWQRVVLTGSCTQALALALTDFPHRHGDVVLTSGLEHHALLRGLFRLQDLVGIQHETVPGHLGAPMVLEALEARLSAGGVTLVACTTASNVTGEVLPIADVVRLAHAHGARCLLDAAQTAGLMPPSFHDVGADMMTLAGHKSPMAPLGLGGLYVSTGLELTSPAAVCQAPNTGAAPPPCGSMPSWCDVGSANLVAAAGLVAGVQWLQNGGLHAHQQARTRAGHLRDALARLPGITVLHGGTMNHTAAVSMVAASHRPQQLAAALAQAGITAAAGFHCAPLAHQQLGTAAAGTLRISPGPFTTDAELERALSVLAGAVA